MTLLDLAHQTGLQPKYAASTAGGEYHSECPVCGGKDRFYIQPEKEMPNCKGYYRCRQCEISGDTIQFAMDFKGIAFKEAVEYVSATLPERNNYLKPATRASFTPAQICPPPNLWQTKATALVTWAHKNIWEEKEILGLLDKRGLPAEVIRRYKIGWNPQEIVRNKEDWGIAHQQDNNRLWIPAGIVIPSLERNGDVQRIKIRRTAWKPTDTIGKYIALPSNMSGLTIIGDTQKDLMIVVESELDAYAIHCAIYDVAFVVAVGSNIRNPDNVTDYFAKRKALLICYDNDEGGNAMWNKWKKLYPHAYPYPAPLGKDIGESVEQGLKIRPWILQYKWDKTIDQELIDYALKYIHESTTRHGFTSSYESEIFMGPNSPRAKTRELQRGLRLMREWISKYQCGGLCAFDEYFC